VLDLQRDSWLASPSTCSRQCLQRPSLTCSCPGRALTGAPLPLITLLPCIIKYHDFFILKNRLTFYSSTSVSLNYSLRPAPLLRPQYAPSTRLSTPSAVSRASLLHDGCPFVLRN
jgi:hypothetical protein